MRRGSFKAFVRSMHVVGAAAVGVVGLGMAGVAQADRLDEFMSPVTNPVNFEDPRATTEIRPIFIYHKLDNDFVTQGGDVRIYALQARFAVDDRLAIIATKDGYIDFNPDAVLSDEEGFANVTAGAKYALIKDGEAGQILTAGFRYEIPMGNRDVLHGYGDGALNPFLSGAMAFGSINVMAGTGFRFAIDNKDSTFYDFDMSVGTAFGNFYPALELNVVHVLDAGNRLPIADEGQDFFNFGSSLSDGKTIVTGGVSGRYKLSDTTSIGVGYQFPMTSGAGSRVTDWRITTDLIVKFDI